MKTHLNKGIFVYTLIKLRIKKNRGKKTPLKMIPWKTFRKFFHVNKRHIENGLSGRRWRWYRVCIIDVRKIESNSKCYKRKKKCFFPRCSSTEHFLLRITRSQILCFKWRCLADWIQIYFTITVCHGTWIWFNIDVIEPWNKNFFDETNFYF